MVVGDPGWASWDGYVYLPADGNPLTDRPNRLQKLSADLLRRRRRAKKRGGGHIGPPLHNLLLRGSCCQKVYQESTSVLLRPPKGSPPKKNVDQVWTMSVRGVGGSRPIHSFWTLFLCPKVMDFFDKIRGGGRGGQTTFP